MHNLPLPNLSLDELIRFWGHIRKTEHCWIWTGATTAFGHGQVRIRQKLYYASRIAYWIDYKTDPGKLLVCHNCSPLPDDPKCVRPDHLWLGTTGENVDDCKIKGGFSKRLNFEDIQSIPELRASGMTIREIANYFQVSLGSISYHLYD